MPRGFTLDTGEVVAGILLDMKRGHELSVKILRRKSKRFPVVAFDNLTEVGAAGLRDRTSNPGDTVIVRGQRKRPIP